MNWVMVVAWNSPAVSLLGLCQLVIKVTLNGKTAEPGGRVVGTREQI